MRHGEPDEIDVVIGDLQTAREGALMWQTRARELAVALRVVLRCAGKSGQVNDNYRVISCEALKQARKILKEQGYE